MEVIIAEVSIADHLDGTSPDEFRNPGSWSVENGHLTLNGSEHSIATVYPPGSWVKFNIKTIIEDEI